MIFDSIINRGEFFSDHYLDALAQQDLAGLRRAWDETENGGEDTPRTRIRSLGKSFFAAKAAVAEGDEGAQLGLHDTVLAALGFAPNRRQIELTRGGEEEAIVPAAHAAETHSGLLLVALDLGFAVDIDDALGADGAGHLLAPVLVEGGKTRIDTATEAVSYLFAADEPPRYALLFAGGVLVLADRGKWAEGKFLAVDLDLALSRADTKAKGELETIAALFSADALVPTEGQSVLDQLAAASHKHAIGVSEDLRDGIRQSIELLANEVIRQRKEAKLRVYEEPGLANQLTTQCLRFLYRLLFLLYAEARPELGILPLDHPEYREGYGLDRLRDLALTALSSEKARNGGHIQESLKLLFRLVNDGYHHTGAQLAFTDGSEASVDVGLTFEPLHSELFSPRATPLLDSVRLRNEVLQEVLSLLLLSREQRGRERGFVSYAQLGINQLGAVYEGLMAYTGFFADEELYEVARPGAKPSEGTWVVPVAKADEYPEEVFVTRTDDFGQPRRVRHAKGSFVFRLSGRDRQRSASYYTPEVLTACVVRHALAELLDQNGETTPASAILDLTICEPALGSGAFLNEAINRLSAEYLRRRQAELDESLDPEYYTAELQKVKAHFALHQCYGVDLNATAVELAEVSLWLNAMHPGLQAPWFGLHLRRGNSLVGARRATYYRNQLARGAWLKALPHDRHLEDGRIGDEEIHHFLLPAAGWGAVCTTDQAIQLCPDEAKALRTWRQTITAVPSKRDTDRLVALARRVEELWTLAGERLRLAEGGLRRKIDIYGQEPSTLNPATREMIESSLSSPDSALSRLRTVMDAWTALWFWPISTPSETRPPTLSEWLDALESLLGVDPGRTPRGQLQLFDDLDDLASEEQQLAGHLGMQAVSKVESDYPWLLVLRRIAAEEGFFHWELEFDPVLRRGGFDLQIGNPPWVRPEWRQGEILGEFDARFAVTDQREAATTAADALPPHQLDSYLATLSSHFGLIAALTDRTLRPRLEGLHTNLYRTFVDNSPRLANRHRGVTGLLHPDTHFVDGKALTLREWCFHSLRRCWRFINQLLLFEDVGNTRPFAINIYQPAQAKVAFDMACNLLHPATLEESLSHDGSGDVPGIKRPDGSWDLTPHLKRILTVDSAALESWTSLFSDSRDGRLFARLPQLQSKDDRGVLEKAIGVGRTVRQIPHLVDGGLKETASVDLGIIRRDCHVPPKSVDQVFQNPHFTICNPYFQDANPGCRNHRDYSPLDLELLPTTHSHRSNFRIDWSRTELLPAFPVWKEERTPKQWRLIYRRRIDPQGARTLQAAILFPGPVYVDASHAVVFEDEATMITICGLWASLPFDFFVRVLGKADLYADVIEKLPYPNTTAFNRAIALRVLRLNCVTSDYAPLWDAHFDPSWRRDRWTTNEVGLSKVERTWSMACPLRVDRDRRQALVELDAIVAVCLGLSQEELVSIFRSQFGVLRGYERAMYFDANGRQVPSDVLKAWKRDPSGADLGRYVLPFDQPDREKEMRIAYEEFARREAAEEL